MSSISNIEEKYFDFGNFGLQKTEKLLFTYDQCPEINWFCPLPNRVLHNTCSFCRMNMLSYSTSSYTDTDEIKPNRGFVNLDLFNGAQKRSCDGFKENAKEQHLSVIRFGEYNQGDYELRISYWQIGQTVSISKDREDSKQDLGPWEFCFQT